MRMVSEELKSPEGHYTTSYTFLRKVREVTQYPPMLLVYNEYNTRRGYHMVRSRATGELPGEWKTTRHVPSHTESPPAPCRLTLCEGRD